MSFLCPCPFGSKTSQKLVEMSPFRDAGSGSEDEAPAPATLADKAKGWLATAAAPLQKLREHQAKEAAKAEKVGVLKAGATMKLLPDAKGEIPKDVRVSLSQDGAMLTWSGAGGSGVMALSAVRDVKPVLAQGIFRAGGPVPCQWMCVADDQAVRFEASSDEVKTEWMSTLVECVAQQMEAKSGRKLAYQAKRQIGLEQKRREAERRKAEVLKTCSGGGMKHTGARARTRATRPVAAHTHMHADQHLARVHANKSLLEPVFVRSNHVDACIVHRRPARAAAAMMNRA